MASKDVEEEEARWNTLARRICVAIDNDDADGLMAEVVAESDRLLAVPGGCRNKRQSYPPARFMGGVGTRTFERVSRDKKAFTLQLGHPPASHERCARPVTPFHYVAFNRRPSAARGSWN